MQLGCLTLRHTPALLFMVDVCEETEPRSQIGATCFPTTPPEKTHFRLERLRPRAR